MIMVMENMNHLVHRNGIKRLLHIKGHYCNPGHTRACIKPCGNIELEKAQCIFNGTSGCVRKLIPIGI